MVLVFKTLPSFLAQSAGRFALAVAAVCYWAVVGLFALLFEEILIPEVPGVWIKRHSDDRDRKQKLHLWSNAFRKKTLKVIKQWSKISQVFIPFSGLQTLQRLKRSHSFNYVVLYSPKKPQFFSFGITICNYLWCCYTHFYTINNKFACFLQCFLLSSCFLSEILF